MVHIAPQAAQLPCPQPAPPAIQPAAEVSAETAQLIAQLRRSQGHSPQIDQAVGQLLSLLA